MAATPQPPGPSPRRSQETGAVERGRRSRRSVAVSSGSAIITTSRGKVFRPWSHRSSCVQPSAAFLVLRHRGCVMVSTRSRGRRPEVAGVRRVLIAFLVLGLASCSGLSDLHGIEGTAGTSAAPSATPSSTAASARGLVAESRQRFRAARERLLLDRPHHRVSLRRDLRRSGRREDSGKLLIWHGRSGQPRP